MLFCFHRSLYKKCWKQQILKQWKPSDIFTIINENRKLKYKIFSQTKYIIRISLMGVVGGWASKGVSILKISKLRLQSRELLSVH